MIRSCGNGFIEAGESCRVLERWKSKTAGGRRFLIIGLGRCGLVYGSHLLGNGYPVFFV